MKNRLKILIYQHNLDIPKVSRLVGLSQNHLKELNKLSILEWSKADKYLIARVLDITRTQLEYELSKDYLVPFVVWMGGKTNLLKEILKYVPKQYNNYYEPFLGGGALFFSLMPDKAYINDYNFELMNTLQCIKNNEDEVIDQLNQHNQKNDRAYYYKIRALDRTEEFNKLSNIQRAGRFIYLDKAGFNGLWRVNKKGQNNVAYDKRIDDPSSRRTLALYTDNMHNISKYLFNQDITISNGNYLNSLKTAKSGDFVYLDPPYIPINTVANFTSYTETGFNMQNQLELLEEVKRLTKLGVKVMISNSNVPEIYDIYSDEVFNIHLIKVNRSMSKEGKQGKKIGEVLITNY